MSTPTNGRKSDATQYFALALAVAAGIPWAFIRFFGEHPSDPVTAVMTGCAILGAAFVLSWGVEVAEMDLPTALAVSILALIAVLPEYAVDATFAWKAAHDPVQAEYAVANMTGGNRLVLGFGWPLLVLIAWLKWRKPGIELPKSTGSDVAILFTASLYAIVPIMRGSIALIDTAILLSLYTIYVIAAARGEPEGGDDHGHDLVGPAAVIGMYAPTPRRLAVLAMFVYAATIIFVSAEPFAESLVHTGTHFNIDEFLLVQWLAPLASESPEFVVASILVARGAMSKGMRTLVSSGVNQWTVLVGTLPVVMSISAGTPSALPMDDRQTEEVLLTAAMGLFGVAVLADLVLTRFQAMLLAALFFGQFFVPDTHGRRIFAVAYLIATAAVFLTNRGAREGMFQAFQVLFAAVRGRPLPVTPPAVQVEKERSRIPVED
jgi:cation:H+ antiporter